MKKIFPLKVAGKNDARVLEAIKNDVRKYVKRERNKTLPPDFDVWEFNCRVGADRTAHDAVPLKEIAGAIDAVALTGVAEVYVEILAAPGHAAPRPAPPQA